MREGLQPAKEHNWPFDSENDKIYFTNWAGIRFWQEALREITDEPTITLRIDPTGMDFGTDEEGTSDAGEKAYWCFKDVPFRKIRVIGSKTADYDNPSEYPGMHDYEYVTNCVAWIRPWGVINDMVDAPTDVSYNDNKEAL